MKNIDFELGRLSGVLAAFALINTKCNHGYTFEIVNLHTNFESKNAFQHYFLEMYSDAKITFEELSLTDLKVRDALKTWLFSYQKADDADESLVGLGSSDCYLDDKYEAFVLNERDAQQSFLENFLVELKSLLVVQKVYQVFVKTNSWYECAWDDFIFEGKDGSIFLHLGVSD
ncbi:hypothetical protein [Acinetobacter sp. CFCC 10889]|uniref:hypothetical protein n=1 Tax=Acinetobacter sp. CFCC 10889 TaxID=1775557 RepID=UPI000DD09837|nr:hypothetical protein [Acinetobacter sp. CFCC 10889]